MIVKALVGLPDQSPVKTILASTRLIRPDKQDRLLLWIERERNTPGAARCAEPHLLHVLCFEPLNVSQWGRFNVGPNLRNRIIDVRKPSWTSSS